jgi:hypothetical protein
LTVLLAVALTASGVWADKPTGFDAQGNEKGWAKSGCTTTQSGLITDSAGNPVTVGYDQFGYNYQADMFNGTYDSSDRVLDGKYWGTEADYVDDKLMMKWSDPWLANVDCDNNGKLDRGLEDGVLTGTSVGWLTNHVEGDYFDGSGAVQHYTSFTKIVWTGPGSPLWGQYTIIEDVYSDPAAGFTGLLDKPGAPGFGLNDHWTPLP